MLLVAQKPNIIVNQKDADGNISGFNHLIHRERESK
jgi:hypothetical protein